jgi:hypothetical protein
MSADQGSHKRSFLRLRKSLVFGGINLYQELASIWFRAETYWHTGSNEIDVTVRQERPDSLPSGTEMRDDLTPANMKAHGTDSCLLYRTGSIF